MSTVEPPDILADEILSLPPITGTPLLAPTKSHLQLNG